MSAWVQLASATYCSVALQNYRWLLSAASRGVRSLWVSFRRCTSTVSGDHGFIVPTDDRTEHLFHTTSVGEGLGVGFLACTGDGQPVA